MRTQFPNLAAGEAGEGGEGGEEDESEEREEDADEVTPAPVPRRRAGFSSPSQASILASSSISPPTPFQSSTPHTTNLLMRTRQALLPSSSATPAANPSINQDGKWAPQHQWTHFYDMMYAKRCMAILTHRSPRKSNLVITKGKQWMIDWATGKLTRCEPPEYGEITMGVSKEENVLVPHIGETVRV